MYFDADGRLAGLIINNLGWIVMVVGQSVVLYSRLGILLGNPHSRLLTFTKWLIAFDAIAFYSLATVVVFGMHYSSDPGFRNAYKYEERIQMTGFCLQEFFISGVYIWKSLEIIKAGEKRQAHRLLWQLFIINVVIVALDVALLVVEYINLSWVEISFKGLAYSVKLKLEFAILSKLVEFSELTKRKMSAAFSDPMFTEEMRPSRGTVSQLPNSPQLAAAVHPAWTDGEKPELEHDDIAPHSTESSLTTSHNTDHSELQLFEPQLIPIKSNSYRRTDDGYHDMIKVISKSPTS